MIGDNPRVNTRLKNLLAEAGLSYETFALAVRRIAAEQGRTVRTNKSAVAHWIAGTTPDPDTARYAIEALQRRLGRNLGLADIGLPEDLPYELMPRDPVGAVARLGRADVDRRGFLAGAVYSLGALGLPLSYQGELAARAASAQAGRVGMDEVAAVRDITAAFNRADERLGGGFGRSAVVEYLATDVATYCHATMAEPVRQAMFAEAAQLAYLAGWKCHDIGAEGLAQRYYLHSYQLAVESGDMGQAAYVMRILAHQAYDMGHHDNCLNLASAAVAHTTGRVDNHTSALFSLTEAKAHAMRGDRRDALACLARAEHEMNHASDGDERPAWAGVHGVNAAQFHNHTAKVLADLGELGAAEEHFTRSIRHYLDPVAKPRVHALASTWLAETQCQRGHIEQACRTWTDALARVGGIQSARTREAVGTMRAMIAPFRRRGVAAVARLEAYANEVVAQAV